MTSYTLGEQFLLIGAVDIPATPENTMRLIGVLGGDGFFPAVIKEINLEDGRAINRLSLTNTIDVDIQFNTDRIQIIRSRRPDGQASGIELGAIARKLCRALQDDFNIGISRVVLVADHLYDDGNVQKIGEAYKKFINNYSSGEPFEWFYRVSSLQDNPPIPLTVMKVVEVSRTQGTLILGKGPKNFDAIRMKIEVGTNMHDSSLRFSPAEAVDLIEPFGEILNASFKELEEVYNG